MKRDAEDSPGPDRAHDRDPLYSLPCQNCGEPSDGNYCRECGQHKIDHRTSFRALVADTVEDLSLTSELPRTLKALFFNPGFLTREYSAGRIARYIPPLRLYLAASLVFFLTLSFVTRNSTATSSPKSLTASDTTRAAVVRDSLRRVRISKDTSAGGAAGRRFINTPIKALNVRLNTASERLKKLPPGEAAKRVKDFMIQRAPMMMFMLLPLFALLLNIFFWRTRRHFTEHFVYALHTHALMFFVFAIMLILPKADIFGWVASALMLGTLLYHWLAMKRVYGEGWIRTTLKLTTIGFIYSILFIFAITAEVLAAVLMV